MLSNNCIHLIIFPVSNPHSARIRHDKLSLFRPSVSLQYELKTIFRHIDFYLLNFIFFSSEAVLVSQLFFIFSKLSGIHSRQKSSSYSPTRIGLSLYFGSFEIASQECGVRVARVECVFNSFCLLIYFHNFFYFFSRSLFSPG